MSNIIQSDFNFECRFTFCTLVTKKDEYNEMVLSAKSIGFDKDDTEFIYFDNINSNDFDGFIGINHALKVSKGEYLIFCHQDILFNHDKRNQLEKCLSELEGLDKKWAVAGNAGIRNDGKSIMRISDPNHTNIARGNFPEKVISLDENFIIINRKVNVGCSYGLSGFHLYATDICQNAIDLGLSSYVINFHLLHKSAGKIDHSFYKSRSEFISFYKKSVRTKIIWTMCTSFIISNREFIGLIINSNVLLKRVRKLLKKINKYIVKQGGKV
mgnify:CR=1 FL=1